jgi:4Fe-4S ferredoxin
MPRPSFGSKSSGPRHRRSQPKVIAPETSCKAEPGVFVPVINYHRCEGKGDCAEVCPLDVFVIERMPDEQFSSLPALVKFKLWAHGRKVAFTPNAEACQACGACITACPERAITLKRSQPKQRPQQE